MKLRFPFTLPVLFFVFLVSSCGYRFVNPLPYCSCAIEEVKNTTPEPGVDRVLEKALREGGTFYPASSDRLFVAVTRFEEAVASVDSEGIPIRQKLSMEVSWVIRGEDQSGGPSGRETASVTYPYARQAVQLDWNRTGAIRLLAEEAARKILEQVEASPP